MQTFSLYLERRDPNLYNALLGDTIQLDEGFVDMLKGVYEKVMGKRATPDELLKKVRENTSRYQSYWKSEDESSRSLLEPEKIEEAKKAKQENILLIEKILRMTVNNPKWRKQNHFNDTTAIVVHSGLSKNDFKATLSRVAKASRRAGIIGLLLAGMFSLSIGMGKIGDSSVKPSDDNKPGAMKIVDDKPDDWKNPGFPMPDVPSADQDSGPDIGALQANTRGFRTPVRTILKGPGDYPTPIRSGIKNIRSKLRGDS